MCIAIIYHRKNLDKILRHLRNSQYVSRLIVEFDLIQFVDVITGAYIKLYSVEFIEKYKHSAIYINMAYYPKSETNNGAMMETLNVCTRPIVYGLGHFLGNIFEYDEDNLRFLK